MEEELESKLLLLADYPLAVAELRKKDKDKQILATLGTLNKCSENIWKYKLDVEKLKSESVSKAKEIQSINEKLSDNTHMFRCFELFLHTLGYKYKNDLVDYLEKQFDKSKSGKFMSIGYNAQDFKKGYAVDISDESNVEKMIVSDGKSSLPLMRSYYTESDIEKNAFSQFKYLTEYEQSHLRSLPLREKVAKCMSWLNGIKKELTETFTPELQKHIKFEEWIQRKEDKKSEKIRNFRSILMYMRALGFEYTNVGAGPFIAVSIKDPRDIIQEYRGPVDKGQVNILGGKQILSKRDLKKDLKRDLKKGLKRVLKKNLKKQLKNDIIESHNFIIIKKFVNNTR